METCPRSTDFVALGQPGDRYAGLETFANPGVSHVEMTSDELTAVCRASAPKPQPGCASFRHQPNSLAGEPEALLPSTESQTQLIPAKTDQPNEPPHDPRNPHGHWLDRSQTSE